MLVKRESRRQCLLLLNRRKEARINGQLANSLVWRSNQKISVAVALDTPRQRRASRSSKPSWLYLDANLRSTKATIATQRPQQRQQQRCKRRVVVVQRAPSKEAPKRRSSRRQTKGRQRQMQALSSPIYSVIRRLEGPQSRILSKKTSYSTSEWGEITDWWDRQAPLFKFRARWKKFAFLLTFEAALGTVFESSLSL